MAMSIGTPQTFTSTAFSWPHFLQIRTIHKSELLAALSSLFPHLREFTTPHIFTAFRISHKDQLREVWIVHQIGLAAHT